MVEPRWFLLAAGGERWAVPAGTVWCLSGPARVNVLPGARTWCGGWILLREQFVPVFVGEPFAAVRSAEAFAVLRRGSVLLALPADAVDLAGGQIESGADPGGLPTSETLVCAGGSRAAVLDVERLYRGLGLPIESFPEE